MVLLLVILIQLLIVGMVQEGRANADGECPYEQVKAVGSRKRRTPGTDTATVCDLMVGKKE